ncbi:phage replisome organizer N-terminal domain-containing protein [Leuconostoc carnosum]|uniref:phage replisome organizer N-terminal domain-containing protein n=1 Tax=Leuconostoc carnosum TaxID=1252 RepID=UPI00123A7281|nr:phage replisome organizer N-terminal domain-containing protein [Leuconostoc carnosum]KAA8365699.1 DnaD domain protein [Leuconostoc carnosum]KAA8377147.1 DnaD domain protein [Leuconostoc carnosum]MBR2276864.1 phage replisome organizer N-terminal domain-containing protein [Leuconostoc sp.]WLC97617.1 phage replisome organizer N-terminal domain-containing protein [Leuconostoc carnosum]
MADNKKYYYMRIKEDFFDSDEIKMLESVPNDGYKFSNILLKMYLKSLKYNGRLMFKDRIPFNAQMLATVTNHSVGDVERAIKMFKEFSLIDVMDTGEIYMSDIQNYIGKTSTEADRIKAYRREIDNKKTLGVQMYDKSTPEIELEKEIEIKKDINIEQQPQTNYQKLVAVFEKNGFGTISPIASQKLNDEITDFTQENGNADESFNILNKAFEIAVVNGVSNLNYVLSITKRWYQSKLFTVSDIEASEMKHHGKPSTESKQDIKDMTNEEISKLTEAEKMELVMGKGWVR